MIQAIAGYAEVAKTENVIEYEYMSVREAVELNHFNKIIYYPNHYGRYNTINEPSILFDWSF